jgi:hypothetical protein
MPAWTYKSTEQLYDAGYRLVRIGTCRSPNCGRKIEFWQTPKGKLIPLDSGTFEPHWASCVDAAKFRRAK